MKYTHLILLALLAVLAGCGKAHPAPPSERNSLILRFFSSMAANDAVAASQQGEKLRVMDAGNDYIARLVTIQQSNTFLQRAQEAVNAGDVNRALAALDEGVKAYPLNRDLSSQRARVRQLRNLPMLLREMELAKTSGAMSSALTAATTAMVGNSTPKLAAYFDAYRRKIGEVSREEALRNAGETKAVVPVPEPAVKKEAQPAAPKE